MKFAGLLPVLVAAFLAATTAPASAQTKIATIDLKRVFDGYWKTQQADSSLKEKAGDFEKKNKLMVEDYQKATEEYKKLLDSAGDAAVSAAEKEKRKKAAESKLLEINEIEQSIKQFERSARAQINEQQRQLRDKILNEIRELINSKARAAGYNLVIDSAAETVNSTPVVLFKNGQPDLTDEVLSQLNTSAPPGTLKK
jgi:outer membrane protein